MIHIYLKFGKYLRNIYCQYLFRDVAPLEAPRAAVQVKREWRQNVNISMSQALRLSGLRIISAGHSGFSRLETVRRPVECRLCNDLRWGKMCSGN